MDLQMTQVLDDENVTDNTEDNTQVGILCIGTTRHPIVKGFNKIGRSPAVCNIVLSDTSVSKVHAEIQAGCETAFISDLRSSNGTKIKDVPLKPFFYYTINDGDAIFLGTVKAIFKTNKSFVNSAAILTESPVASRRLNPNNTPGLGDSSNFSFDNSSIYQADDSVVPGTQQKEKRTPIFQEPSVPVDRRKGLNRSSLTVSPSASRKTEKVTKSHDDTDLHDLETQQFSLGAPSVCKRSEKNDKARFRDDETDLYELETQKIDDNSLSRKSQTQKRQNLEKIQQDLEDANIYEAKTQLLSTENEGTSKEDESNKSRINNTANSSGGYNSSSNFSRKLQISSSPSPPESPCPMDENTDMMQSQNLLELCETPLLAHIKNTDSSENARENNKGETTIKDDAIVPETNMEETVNEKKAFASNHVIAESDDESATDDDMDMVMVKADSVITKSSKPSDVIEDDSATDDEGKFESFASPLRSKEKQKSPLNISQKTSKDRKTEANIFEAKNQQIVQKSPNVSGTEKCLETAKNLQIQANIFDAETQQMEDEFVDVSKTKKLPETTKNRRTKGNIFDEETQKMNLENPGVSGEKKRRENLDNHNADENIFEAETQRMEQEPDDLTNPNKDRRLTEEIQDETDIDLLPTQVLDVPTSTPMSRSRKWNLKMSNKNPPLATTEEDLHLAPTQIISDKNKIAENNSTERSIEASPSLDDKVTGKKKDNRASNFKAATSPTMSNTRSRSIRKSKKSPKFVSEENSAPKQITNDEEDIPVENTRERSAGGSSSLGDESKGEEKNNRSGNLDETLMRNLGKILDEEANNVEFGEEMTPLMTQNLVDILRPTQSFDETKPRDLNDEIVDDTREMRSPKKKMIGGSRWSKNLPAAASTMRDDDNEDEEETNVVNKKSKISEWLDPDSILFGLPEVKISGTLSNPGSPTPSTTSSHSDFVASSLRETGISAKTKTTVAGNSKFSPSSLITKKAAKSLELDSPVIKKKSRVARNKIPRKIIEDEEQEDSDKAFGYNDLMKIANNLLASDTVDSKKSSEKDINDGTADGPEKLSSTGRPMRHIRKAIAPKKDVVSSRRNRKLPQAPSSLIVSDARSKRSVDESTSTDAESSSIGATRSSPRLPKSKKPTNSRFKVASKQGKESQEIETFLAATTNDDIPLISRKSYAKIQLTKLDASHVSCTSNDADNSESPKANRKRRATMSVNDLSPATASPAPTKSRRTISEGVDGHEVPKEQHKILMTGLKDDYTKIVKKLGGSVVSEPSKATVLITDKVRRTYKFLCAIAKGLRVVSINWLLESKKAARFLDCDDFILNDPASEKQYRFNLEKSLQKARTKKFLDGYTIVVTPKVNQPEIHELKAMIEASGGKLLTRAPGARAWNGKTVIVSREEDLTAINALLSKCPKSVKITVQTTEFILSGILRQEVNLVEHKLNIL